jgi:hypothetical protein
VTGSIAVGSTDGGQPYENRQPFLAVNYIIALVSIAAQRARILALRSGRHPGTRYSTNSGQNNQF